MLWWERNTLRERLCRRAWIGRPAAVLGHRRGKQQQSKLICEAAVRGRAMPAMFCSRSSKSPSLLAHSAMIDHLYYELGTGGVGTFTVTISYGNMEAQATILVRRRPTTTFRIKFFP